MLLWNDKHKKSPRRGSGKGSCHIPPCGLLLGCLKGQNLGNQFCFQTAAQFFINVADNDFLNFSAESMQGWGYCVFAEVVEGMDVVDKIKGVSTGRSGMHQDVPKEDVIIENVTVSE